MKEQSAGSHSRVASSLVPSTAARQHHHGTTAAATTTADNNNGTKCFGGPCIDSEEDEEDWDLGIGKLVIDLDADADKTRSPPSGKTGANSGKMNTSGGSPPKSVAKSASGDPSLSSGSSSSHGQGGGDKGLKVKIKRSSGKSSGMTTSVTTSMTGGQSVMCTAKNDGASKNGDTRNVFVANSNSTSHTGHETFGHAPQPNSHQMSAHPSTMDRLKHSLAEREKSSLSSSTKNRSHHKKERHMKSDRSKTAAGNDPHTAGGVGTYSVSAAGSSLASTAPASSATAQIAQTPATPTPGPSSITSVTVELDRVSMTTLGNGSGNVKRELPSHDPYEFNAKVEDRIGVPMKKIKVEKTEPVPTPSTSEAHGKSQDGKTHDTPDRRQTEKRDAEQRQLERPPLSDNSVEMHDASAPSDRSEGGRRDASVETSHVGVITDPDCLGPCEPGTSVVLEGLVWNETNNGLLVVNVTWRGKTYVGTLMDATKHDWAPPRLNCDSPNSDFDSRTPKGRGKRGRGGGPPPKAADNGSDRKLRSNRRTSNNNGFIPPASPARFDSSAAKRKARSEPDPAMFDPPKSTKRSRTDGQVIDASSSAVVSNSADGTGLIMCPEPNCSKKYRHMNGLKYHQSHAHKTSSVSCSEDGDVKEEKSCEGASTSEQTPCPTPAMTPEMPSAVKYSRKDSESKDTPSGKKKAEKKSESKTQPEASSIVKVKEEPVEKEELKAPQQTKDKKEEQAKVPQQPKDKKEAPPRPEEKPAVTVPVVSAPEPKKLTKVTVAPVTVSKPAIAPVPVKYQIVSTQISLVTNSVAIVNQAPSQVTVVGNPAVSNIKMATVAPVRPVAAANLTAVPVTMATVSSVPVTIPVTNIVKVEPEKKKKDKTEKSKKSTPVSTTRPIMPAPATTVAHAAISTQAGIAQVNTVSSLKPIQPKPTILGESSKVNPALASLKEMKEKEKEKKQKKKKKDKDRDRHKESEKSPHDKSKVGVASVIKTAPAAAIVPRVNTEMVIPRVNTETVITVQKVDASTPPQLEKQQPVGSSTKEGTLAPIQNKAQLAPKTGPDTVSSNTLNPNQEQDAHSPAYSDISDANEAAPTLEKETQPLREEPVTSERPPSVQTLDAHGVYSPYYGQPPFLTPAVQPSGTSSKTLEAKDGQPVAASAPTKGEGKDPGKSSQDPGKKESSVAGGEGKPAMSPVEQQQKQQQQKIQQQAQQQQQQQRSVHGQYPYPQQYYNIDPNYMQRMAANPEMRERFMEEQRRRHEQAQQHAQQQQQQHQSQSQQPQQQGQSKSQQHQVQHQQHQQQHDQPFQHQHQQQHTKQQQHAQQHQMKQPQQRPTSDVYHSSTSQSAPVQSNSQSQPSPNPPQQKASSSKTYTQQQSPQVVQQIHHPGPQPAVQAVPVSHNQQSPQNHSPQIKHHKGHSHQQQAPQPTKTYTQLQPASHQRSPHSQPSNGGQSEHDRSKSHNSSKNKVQSAEKSDQNRSHAKEGGSVNDDRNLPNKKVPPSLISDREREEQRRRDRERTDQNLREKQNENREILKENIAIKEQMDNRKFETYDPKTMYDKQRSEELRYYMFQQQRYLEQQQYMKQQGKGGPDKGKEAMLSPQDRPDGGDAAKQQTPRADSKREQEHHPKDGKVKQEEDRPKSVDRTSACSSPRTTPKPREAGPQNPGGPVPMPFNAYYPHPYQYGNQMATFDPNHSGMYPVVNPVMAYPGPAAYIHPSQLRYHVPPEGLPRDKVMMMSPGAPRPEGKALDLLQQHASQYYNASGAQHKIHELEDVAKRSDKGQSAASPVAKEVERPDSRNSTKAAADAKNRGSPPAQRHLHTHHHTHVVGPSYPIPYGSPYGTPIIASPNSSSQPSTPSPIAPHTFPPK